MEIIFTNVYLFVLATVLAILEVQIEGKHGWAKNLPTWRPKNPNFFTKLYTGFLSGKDLTGYHLSMFSFVFLIFGLPYVFGLPLTLENILKTVSFYFMFCILWDFLWFVLNPHYPLKQFKKEHLDFHHKKWFFGIPTDYWGGALVSLLVLIPVMQGGSFLFGWWLINICMFGLETILIIAFSLYILKIDKWHSDES
jgi:hypothetical protein